MHAIDLASRGFLLSAGLIIAIGAQNAFVLRQGLARAHVGLIVAFCAGADAALILAGGLGFGSLVADHPVAIQGVRGLGALFLAAYAVLALRRARRPDMIEARGPAEIGRGRVLGLVAALTFLNPHVYLDTVVLLGGIAGAQPLGLRGWFLGGAMAASALWFSCLGYGARVLSPLFARPEAWRIVDLLVGATMAGLACGLVWDLWRAA